MSSDCSHQTLHLDLSPHAAAAGFERLERVRRLAAAQPSGRAPAAVVQSSTTPTQTVEHPKDSTFPAPLVLPGDELSWDPKYPPQSLRSWIQCRDRNPVTPDRRTIYVVPPPKLGEGVVGIKRWADLGVKPVQNPPRFEDVVAYLKAFYHGLPVKSLERPQLKFVPWESKDKPSAREIALCTDSEAIHVRTRSSKPYMKQMNLNDLLDVAIEILPDDAYALLMIVPYDLYEDDNDDFCCGRAYGGSRVAVVSSARYNPNLDAEHGVEGAHVWPASHCKSYIDVCCGAQDVSSSVKKKRKIVEPTNSYTAGEDTAISAALAAHMARSHHTHQSSLDAIDRLQTLWLGRVCKTASHELGHCLALDHCVYYACVMQGTANMVEDARQPPYLCPVDTAKLLRATGAGERDWCLAVRECCDRFQRDAMFGAFVAWLNVRLIELDHRT